MTVARRLARLRVPLGFVFAAAVLYLARPTLRSIAIGAAVGVGGQAIRLWAELAEQSGDEHGVMPHKFLYFPDENHWVLTPQHAKVWYDTVFAFLAHTVLGEEWRAPDILR